MKSKKVAITLFVIVMFVLQACGLPAIGGSDSAETEAPVLTEGAPTEEPAPQPEIVHTTIPNSGTENVANAHDNEESTSFESRAVVFGDQFDINRFERPFTSETMDYLPHVDIVGISMTQDDNFYYVQIKLAGVDSATGGASGSYAVDFDLNIDGKAEFIVIANNLTSAQWTTDGVSIYVDANNNVGGQNIRPDDIYTGDGFETLSFDSGNGNDPDAAWAHFANNASPVVEIALKKSLLEAKPAFMWSVTTSAQKIDPTKFYFNDTFSEERAGSPIQGEYYPLKELAGVDNTCRLPAGFQPTGTEPLGCSVAVAPNQGGGQPGFVFPDFDFDFDICAIVIFC